jgi:dynactin 1
VNIFLNVVARLLRVSLGGVEGGGPSGKDSLAYKQLEKHNERLKEALIKQVFSQSVLYSGSRPRSDYEICPTKRSKNNEGDSQRWKRISSDSMIFSVRKTHLRLKYVVNRSTAQYDSALIKLSNAETQIEDLKLQLDDALGAEEMLVQLTERNLMLSEVRGLHSLVEFWLNGSAENRGDADHD